MKTNSFPKFNKKNVKHIQQVHNIIYSVALHNGNWNDIVIRTLSQFSIKNWDHIRNVVKTMKNNRIISNRLYTYEERFFLVGEA